MVQASAGGKLFRPHSSTVDRINSVLDEPIPPGPTYRDLIEEVWGRGFEIYLVGGIVRDVLSGDGGNDVDLVTTMPLQKAHQFLKSMYVIVPKGNGRRGYIRLGGTPRSGDPFIDLKVFSNCFMGTDNAAFGVGFDRDVVHRDFACNSLYYDAINGIIVDPTGRGIQDATNKTLRLVCATDDRRQKAQIFIRYIKFLMRGYTPTEDTEEAITKGYARCLSGMTRDFRRSYLITQVTSKIRDIRKKREALIAVKAQLVCVGASDVWSEFFDIDIDAMFSDA